MVIAYFLHAEAKDSTLHHVKFEESTTLPDFRANMSPENLDRMGEVYEGAKKMAPTSPHPGAPSSTVNLITGPLVGLWDKIRDSINPNANVPGQQS